MIWQPITAMVNYRPQRAFSALLAAVTSRQSSTSRCQSLASSQSSALRHQSTFRQSSLPAPLLVVSPQHSSWSRVLSIPVGCQSSASLLVVSPQHPSWMLPTCVHFPLKSDSLCVCFCYAVCALLHVYLNCMCERSSFRMAFLNAT